MADLGFPSICGSLCRTEFDLQQTKSKEIRVLIQALAWTEAGTDLGNIAMSAAVNIHAHRCSLGSSLDLCLDYVKERTQTNPETQTEDSKPSERHKSQKRHLITSTHHHPGMDLT